MAEWRVRVGGEEVVIETLKSDAGHPQIRVTLPSGSHSVTGSLTDIADLRAKFAAAMNVSDGSRTDTP